MVQSQTISVDAALIGHRYLNVLASLQVTGLGVEKTFPGPPHTDVELVGNRPVQAEPTHRDESNPQVRCTSQTLEK